MTKQQICCFIGHRNLPKDKEHDIILKLEAEIKSLIKKGVTQFRMGCARGFDTLAALTVLKLKYKYEGISLNLVIPCLNQTKGWSDEDIAKYNYILNHSDKINTQIIEFKENCMEERNRKLVNGSGYCIAFLMHDFGDTFYTVNYAKSQKVEIINIAK